MKPGRRQAGAAGAASAGAAAAVAAAAASVCCVSPVMAPVLVSVVGASGAAWAAGLKPYSPYMLEGSLALLAYGFWTLYRRQACAPGEAPVSGARSPRWVRLVLWGAAVIWVASLGATLYLGQSA